MRVLSTVEAVSGAKFEAFKKALQELAQSVPESEVKAAMLTSVDKPRQSGEVDQYLREFFAALAGIPRANLSFVRTRTDSAGSWVPGTWVTIDVNIVEIVAPESPSERR